LANRFVNNEWMCFDPRTFLYHEVDLLFQFEIPDLFGETGVQDRAHIWIATPNTAEHQ